MREAGNWQPDALQWIENEKLLEEVVTAAEAVKTPWMDGTWMQTERIYVIDVAIIKILSVFLDVFLGSK